MRINYGCSRKDSSEPAWNFHYTYVRRPDPSIVPEIYAIEWKPLPYGNLVKFQT
ncbi:MULTISPECIES: hypothetical protein [Methanosarcina]|uniref:hypothetical protein n=1 Tax=Methanosarcina TaxID=2207 RepID=UPI001483896E|nr:MULTISPECIES: hypothetical protein [Methanosarcina]MDW5551391.1 hypothetical protein [Methanosarcina sp.]MDW5554426.1 hypothetical protein [Methanosarcina sp.]MDW5559039.1 hypothetical protein [Methanosarcina sp.]